MNIDKIFPPELQELKDRWPWPIVTRNDLPKFSAGLIRNPKSIRNADSKGVGIKGGFRVGRNVAYKVDAVIEYMADKFKTINTVENNDEIE